VGTEEQRISGQKEQRNGETVGTEKQEQRNRRTVGTGEQ